jgi:hypothetical protein
MEPQAKEVVVSIAVFRRARFEKRTAHPTPFRLLGQLAYDLYTFCLCLTEQTDVCEIEFSPDHPYPQDVIREANCLLRRRGFELELQWSEEAENQRSAQILIIKR